MESIIPQKHQHGIKLLRTHFFVVLCWLKNSSGVADIATSFLPQHCHWTSSKLPPTHFHSACPQRVCHINCHPKSIYAGLEVTSNALLQRVCTDAELLTMCNTIMCSSWKTLHSKTHCDCASINCLSYRCLLTYRIQFKFNLKSSVFFCIQENGACVHLNSKF